MFDDVKQCTTRYSVMLFCDSEIVVRGKNYQNGLIEISFRCEQLEIWFVFDSAKQN